MAKERYTAIPYALEKGPRAGDREIRMRPVPTLSQTRPRKEESHV